MNEGNNRRRRYWINPDFQRRYVMRILALQLITMAVTLLFSVMLAFMLMNPGFGMGAAWKRNFAFAFVMVAVPLAAGLGWLGVRLSHKICGPVYRMEMDLKAMREGGCIQRLKLRDGDELQELAASISDTIDYLKDRSDNPVVKDTDA